MSEINRVGDFVYSKLGDKDMVGCELNFDEYAYKLYNKDGDYIGLIDYTEIDYETVYINRLWILPEHRRKGYASEVIALLMRKFGGYYIEGCAINLVAFKFWGSLGVKFDSCEFDCDDYGDCGGCVDSCIYDKPYDYSFYIKCT